MDLPRDLAQWKYETVVELVTTFEFERGDFDFKEVLQADHSQRTKYNDTIRKCACAMANSEGGIIIFGVVDREASRQRNLTRPEDRIVGIPLGEDLAKHFAEKVQGIQRPINYNTIPSPIPVGDSGTRGLFLVEVPRSHIRPHMADGYFCRRSPGGHTVSMTYGEVSQQMIQSDERIAKLGVVRAQLTVLIQIARRIEGGGTGIARSIERLNTDALSQLIPDIAPLMSHVSGAVQKLISLSGKAGSINRLLDSLSGKDGLNADEYNRLTGLLGAFAGECIMCDEDLVRVEREISGS